MVKILRQAHHDERGATMVTYALVLPIMLVLVFGSIQVWKVMAVRYSLQMGTDRAARQLTWSGRELSDRSDLWQIQATDIARSIVEADLSSNYLAGSTTGLEVSVTPPLYPSCRMQSSFQDGRFAVRAAFRAAWPVRVPFLPETMVTLHVRRTGFIECPNRWDPPPEEHIF